MKAIKKLTAWFALLTMILCMIPASGMTVSAASDNVVVNTWNELRNALQSSEELTVEVPYGTKIEHSLSSDPTDDEIHIVGKKKLKLDGEIHIYNDPDKGVFNLNDSNADLTIGGYCGEITCYLETTAASYLGNMFYLTDGKLTLSGNSFLTMDYRYYADDKFLAQQSVVGGTGGEVIVDGAYLAGSTIFGEGIDFTFKNGSIGCATDEYASYKNTDLYMISGSATFEGCSFERGILVDPASDATLIMGDDAVCIDFTDKSENADHTDVVLGKTCAFVRFGFAKMTPEMPALSSNYELGTFCRGEEPYISAITPRQNHGLGELLRLVAEIDVYHDGDSYYSKQTSISETLDFDLQNVPAGRYDVYYRLLIEFNGMTVRTKTFRYVVYITDEIAHVDLTLDKTDMDSLSVLQDYAGVSNIKWYEKSKTNNTWTENPATLRDGYTYAVEFSMLSIGNNHTFSSGYTVAINGDAATSLGNGRWRYEYTKTGYLTRIEMYDIQRPAPGQTPDFTAHKDNPPHASYELVWTPYTDGEIGEPLTASDTFEPDTPYLLQVILTADDNYEFDYYTPANGAYAYINNKEALTVSYPENTASKIVAYMIYHTSYCISQVDLTDLQYPIPGKTPDTDICYRYEDNRFRSVSYTDNSDIEWYYETNPGTSAAGFAKLDGKFKSDRRHQAYVQLQAEEYAWFATDNQGDLAITAYFDGEPMAFAYSTDAYTDDGAVNTIEIARTFELANTVDGVFIDGMALTDGLYLDSDHWGIQTEDTVDKDAGYAYYQDGVLTLHNFSWDACGDYNAIDSYKPLTIRTEGTSQLTSVANGLSSTNTLTLTGDGQLNLYGDSYGMFTMGDITVENGTWIVKSETDYGTGLWLYDSLTVNNGTLDIYGADMGLYGDDYPSVNVNGGTLIARADRDYAIAWCDVSTANGAKTTVGMNTDGSGAALWDGTTDFIDCSYVKITFESDILLGDYDQNGIINMRDVMQLYKDFSVGKAMTDYQKAAGDYDQNGTINMRDVLSLYKFISGK